ncbi:MAG: hypothetical protein ACHREM_23775 [Polyangiales bacterium]
MTNTGGDSLAAKPVDLDAVRKLADAATPGPWTSGNCEKHAGEPPHAGCHRVRVPNGTVMCAPADRDFAAAARTLIPEMRDEIEALRAKLAYVTKCYADLIERSNGR